jgi:penicillin-binding protein 2
MRMKFVGRLLILTCVFSICFLLLFVRLFSLQILHGKELKDRAIQGQTRYLSAEEVARGDIVDASGKSLLVGDNKAMAVFVSKEHGVIATEAGKGVIESDQLMDTYNVSIKSRYGAGALARHLIGHLQGDKGANGLEMAYNQYLMCEERYFWELVLDARGKVVPELSFGLEEVEQVSRHRLVLTLDYDIQAVVEDILDQQQLVGAVVVINPHNGDLLAVASRPNYDQNIVTQANNHESYLNRAFQHYYPGSIFKILIGAAALEEGIVDIWEKHECNGSFIFPTGLTINCWQKDGHGSINMTEAMAFSCNTVFIKYALELGRKNLIKYTDRLGLNSNQILGYPQSPLNYIKIDYGPGKVANAALGQEGIMLTPVQMAVLVSSIANGGYTVTPRVVKSVIDQDDNPILGIPSVPPHRVWSGDTASKIGEMLYAVNRWGTGINAWSDNVPSAGKTGSAEAGKGINAIYAGYFPIDSPQYAVVVLIKDGSSGGKSAAPIFKKIIERISGLN